MAAYNGPSISDHWSLTDFQDQFEPKEALFLFILHRAHERVARLLQMLSRSLSEIPDRFQPGCFDVVKVEHFVGVQLFIVLSVKIELRHLVRTRAPYRRSEGGQESQSA